VVWRPDKTLGAAAGTLSSLLQALIDMLIWFCVVVVPFLLPAVVVWLLWQHLRRKKIKPAPLPEVSALVEE
jgi:hypothetical protein